MNRQKIALTLLLVVFAGAIVYSFLGGPKQRKAEKLKYVPGMSAEYYRNINGAENGTRLRLDLLDGERPRFSGFHRNIFKSVFASQHRAPLVPARRAPAPPPPTPPPPPPVKTPAQVAMEEVGRFVFLGYLQKENRKTIFLTKDNQIFLLKKGDRIGGRYSVAEITENMLTIALAPGGEQVVIPLTQNRPLTH
ncbi:MAG TPA: hypothetical protein VMC44_05970 [Geobacteraceae bacterium]|nr:hypothetical protein [Geobacteraceae bacterium]